MDELARRAAIVRNDEGLRRRLIAAALAVRVPFEESPHVEEQIYRGFYSRSDQALIEEFHRADWPRRLELSGAFRRWSSENPGAAFGLLRGARRHTG